MQNSEHLSSSFLNGGDILLCFLLRSITLDRNHGSLDFPHQREIVGLGRRLAFCALGVNGEAGWQHDRKCVGGATSCAKTWARHSAGVIKTLAPPPPRRIERHHHSWLRGGGPPGAVEAPTLVGGFGGAKVLSWANLWPDIRVLQSPQSQHAGYKRTSNKTALNEPQRFLT